MPGFIRAIVAATVLQIIVVVGLVLYMSSHDTNVAREYAYMAESNAKAYAEQRDLDLYNRLQQERNADRLDMQLYLEKQITLQLLKRNHE